MRAKGKVHVSPSLNTIAVFCIKLTSGSRHSCVCVSVPKQAPAAPDQRCTDLFIMLGLQEKRQETSSSRSRRGGHWGRWWNVLERPCTERFKSAGGNPPPHPSSPWVNFSGQPWLCGAAHKGFPGGTMTHLQRCSCFLSRYMYSIFAPTQASQTRCHFPSFHPLTFLIEINLRFCPATNIMCSLI